MGVLVGIVIFTYAKCLPVSFELATFNQKQIKSIKKYKKNVENRGGLSISRYFSLYPTLHQLSIIQSCVFEATN